MTVLLCGLTSHQVFTQLNNYENVLFDNICPGCLLVVSPHVAAVFLHLGVTPKVTNKIPQNTTDIMWSTGFRLGSLLCKLFEIHVFALKCTHILDSGP